MYSYIKGYIAEKTNDSVIIENNGIGYNIYTSLTDITSVSNCDIEVKFYTYLYVREDVFSLYGFLTKEEIKMFLLLISVSGVGPKAAIAIMSALTPSKFSLCVITDDVKLLTTAQGIGKKLAQRIILELKDKIRKEDIETSLGIENATNIDTPKDKSVSDAIEALLVLGYSRESAFSAVKTSYTEEIDLETLIKKSLKSLSK